MAAIARFGTRMVPEREQIIRECREKGQLVEGPHIAAFEEEFARFLGGGHVSAVSTEYGRMGLYFILKALDLPAGSEIIVPALTFWVVPEITRVAGLTPVFVDIDPATFTMSPEAAERAITPKTRAILPTHLYGMACDLDPILALAKRHNLKVVEDCAHALGATVNGKAVGTIGDAGFFSFQTLKPLNCYGGGMALVRDAGLASRVRALADAEPWPDQKRIENRLLVGRLQRIFTKPSVFTISAFPILWFSSLIGANPDVYLWETIRPLDPLPDSYRERFPNVQAAIGLAALEKLDAWTDLTRRHARVMDEALGGLSGITIPKVPSDRTHVYYQYCVYGPQRDELVVRCVRRGVDIETLHVDVCSDLDLFAGARVEPAGAPGAHRAAGAMQIPVYSGLSDKQAARVARVVRRVLATTSRGG